MLREALPCSHVVAPELATPELRLDLVEQIAMLHYFGVRVVLVHGGGPQLTEVSEAMGLETRMVSLPRHRPPIPCRRHQALI